MIACPSFLDLEYKRSFFQMQSTDKMISEIGLLLRVSCLSNIAWVFRYKVLKVIFG